MNPQEHLKALQDAWKTLKKVERDATMTYNTYRGSDPDKVQAALHQIAKLKQPKQDLMHEFNLLKKQATWDEFKTKVQRNIDYGKYLGKHKYYVAKAGLQLDLPLTSMVLHDWSKMAPKAWPKYRDWFYDTEHGRLGDKSLHADFRKAVDYHYKTNSHGHHWYKSNTPIEKVPVEYRLESLADWYGVTAANWNKPEPRPTFKEWYTSTRTRLPLDPVAKALADEKLIHNL